MRWSQVALPGVSPACDPVISTCFFILSLTILSYILLARVIPLSLEQFPFFPLSAGGYVFCFMDFIEDIA